MSYVPPLNFDEAPPASQDLWNAQVKAHGRMTNMKKTLAHSPLALRVLMEWYPLRDTVAAFLGARRTTLFAHAVSSATDCLICSTFFRRLLKESGENPDALVLDNRDESVVAFGRALAKDKQRVPRETMDRLQVFLNHQELVELTAFGAMMVATNIINNALHVELDDYLIPYRST